MLTQAYGLSVPLRYGVEKSEAESKAATVVYPNKLKVEFAYVCEGTFHASNTRSVGS